MATPIRFPSPSRYAKPERFFDAVYRWMCRVTGRYLYFEIYKQGQPLPSLDELAAWLTERAWPRVAPFVVDYQTNATAHDLDGYDFERYVLNAATFCLGSFDGAEVEERAKALRRKAGPRRTAVAPSELFALDGFSVAEQARALGVHPRTVDRYRAKLKLAGSDPVLLERPTRRAPAPPLAAARHELLLELA